ncbi:set domain-containing protein 5 [Colletotrichum musicola]|uniref:Set domain-containing protein 5 n=1 Tax=Colletotrichum musicola TaxID=2175873 RepID=A0A8H6NXK8_9PEZI|nr:set domain-containing protein 5 [Colletotrichum musicola]
MPPLASKDMTWKTVYVTPNIAVGFEPDDEYDWDEYASENLDEVFSSDCADETDSDDTDSDESTATVNVRRTIGTSSQQQTLVPDSRPLLTTYKDIDGAAKEREVIFSNEYFEVRRSPVAGWGAFAKKKLVKGEQILVERALYHASHEEVAKSVRDLPEQEKQIANDLHAFFSRDGECKEEAVWSTNAFASKYPRKYQDDTGSSPKARAGWARDVAGLFPVAARFNHACWPKVSYKYLAREEVLVFTVQDWEIREGEELSISYGKDPSVLYYKFGFGCECGYCGGFDPNKWDF